MNDPILVDTSVGIRYFRGIKNEETDLLDSLIVNDQVLLVPVLLQEILQGIASQNEYQKTLGSLESLHQYNDHIKTDFYFGCQHILFRKKERTYNQENK